MTRQTQQAKHTPGPWHTGVKTAHSPCDIYGRHGESVAIADDITTFPETAKANARLIAAAPELLAALVDLLGDKPDVQHHDCVHCGRAYDDEPDGINCLAEDCPGHIARAAIAKATGAES